MRYININIRQLRDIIRDLDDDLIVLVPGYEGGFDSVEEGIIGLVTKAEPYKWYRGEYDFSNSDNGEYAFILGEENK